jgi:hypothetical protein
VDRGLVDRDDYAAVEGADLDAVADRVRATFWKDVADAPDATPLWGWVLAEAELAAGGRHLGPVGARIVADTIVGLLHADPRSLLRQAPGWAPAARGFGLRHLLVEG